MKRKKRNFYQILILLLLGIGIGYAALTTDLSINGISHVTQSSWSIHFDNIQEDSSSSATINQAAEIIEETSLSYDITLTKPGDYYEFTVDVVNDGTIDGMIGSVSSKLNNVEITTLPNYLEYSVTYEDDIPIAPNHLLNAGDTETYKIHVGYKKDITEEDLPGDTINLHLVFDTPFEQPDEDAIPRPHLPMMQPTSPSDYSAFRSDTYRAKIVTITLDDEINPPANIIESWDIGVAQNGNVMAYITQNSNDNTMYDLYIQGDGHLYANPDSSYLFWGFGYVDAINNIDVLNTSKVTNMSCMFATLGQSSTVFTLDLGDHFDTSNVTNMNNMFWTTGMDSTVFTLDLGEYFDTKKVTDMQAMFASLGKNSLVLTLDLGDKFDTRNVTNMSGMFSGTGKNSTIFSLDLGDRFDTHNVTDMNHMFLELGYSNTAFLLNLGNHFDTGKVTDMSYMFYCTGYKSTIFTLDLGNYFDTSNVENMELMFVYTGYKSMVFTLDLGEKFDTSNVTNMNGMFQLTGRSSTVFTLNLGPNFDTSNVETMSWMFYGLGYSNPNFTLDLGQKFHTYQVTDMNNMFSNIAKANDYFELDLSTFDFSNVTAYNGMFGLYYDSFKATQKIYVKDANDRQWIFDHIGDAYYLSTSNVLIKS